MRFFLHDFVLAVIHFVSLNPLRKDCVLELYVSQWYLRKKNKGETVSKYRNDTYSLRIRAVHCCPVYSAPPADLTPSVCLNSPLSHKAIVCSAGG